MTIKSRTKNNRIICLGTEIVILLVLVAVSGCAYDGEIDQPVVDDAAVDMQDIESVDTQNAITQDIQYADADTQIGTQGVLNTFVAMDYDFSSEILGHSGCVFSVPLLPGDTIEVEITTENPVDFISGDYNFYTSFILNFGKIDTSQSFTIYQEESLSNSNTYYLTRRIDRQSFNLVVRNPSGDYKNIKGHIKIVVHSNFPNSEYDPKPTIEGILAAKDAIQYAYVLQEWDFTSEQYGAVNCLSTVYLLPGDIIAVSVNTENPVDFISGDYVFGVNFLVNNGIIKSENTNSFTIYQSESSSNANSYFLLKQINRKWFELAVRNPSGDFENIRGHKKIIVFSKYSPQEHNDAFIKDYIHIMSTTPDFSQLPYNPEDTSDPDNTWHAAWVEWEAKMEAYRRWKDT